LSNRYYETIYKKEDVNYFFQIRTQKLHGCKLLQCLHQRMHTGVLEINSTLEL